MRPLSIFIGVILTLTLIVTQFGFMLWPETFSFFAPEKIRITAAALIVGVPLFCWFSYWAYTRYRQWQIQRAENTDLTYQKKAIQKLNRQWNQLLKILKSGPDRFNPYTLPWLAIIGPENSGKSRWLSAAGYTQVGEDEEDLILWVGADAVIIEISGHLFDLSKNQLDQPIYNHLFKRLKRLRPRQPLTGVLHSLALPTLTKNSPCHLSELGRKALEWHQTLQQMARMALPGWLIITDCEQLHGYSAQAAGQQDHHWRLLEVNSLYSYSALQEAIRQWQSNHLKDCLNTTDHRPASHQQQEQLYFSLQSALFEERLKNYCDSAFANPHTARVLKLASIFFAATGKDQTDTISVLAAELASEHQFSVNAETANNKAPGPDSNHQFASQYCQGQLALTGSPVRAARLWQAKVALASFSLILLLGGGSWIIWKNISYQSALEEHLKQTLTHYRQQPPTTHALTATLPPLADMRLTLAAYQQPRPWYLRVGLFDTDLVNELQQSYERQLQLFLLPMAEELLADRLRDHLSQQQYPGLADDLRLYLMLFDAHIREPERLNGELGNQWLDQQQVSEAELPELNRLLQDLWSIKSLAQLQDPMLIAQSQKILSGFIDEQLVYDALKARPEYRRLVNPSKRFGKYFNRVFTSGGAEVPYLFTRAGYKSLDLSPQSELLKNIISDLNRVRLGRVEVSKEQLLTMSGKIRERYFLEYIRVWKGVIQKIHLRPVQNTQQADRLLADFYRGQHPAFFDLIAGIKAETQLLEPTSKELSKNDQKLVSQLDRQASRAIKIQGSNKRLARTATLSALEKIKKQRTAQIVNDAFVSYATYEADQGELVSSTLDSIYLKNQSIAFSADPDKSRFTSVKEFAESGSSVITPLQQLANSETSGTKVWLDEMASLLWRQWIAGAQLHIQEQWQDQVMRPWQLMSARFPFNPGSNFDVRPGDFSHFFKPDGTFDSFQQQYVQPFVQKQQQRYRPRQLNGEEIAFSPAFLSQLKQVSKLKGSLFDREGKLQISYKLKASSLSGHVTRFQLRSSNELFSYSHGPALWSDRNWPTDSSENINAGFYHNSVRLAQKRYEGYWAWLRFLFDSKIRQQGPELLATFELGQNKVELALLLQQNKNPFARELFTQLRLPKQIIQADG